MGRNSESAIFVPVLVAVVTGALAGIPALLSYKDRRDEDRRKIGGTLLKNIT